MTIPGSANPLLLASAAAAGGYAIERSVRFNSSDSAYLSRTPASAGNRKTWTWAGWVKRSKPGATQTFFMSAQDASNITRIRFESDDTLRVHHYVGNSLVGYRQTTQVFRDPSAWYHIVWTADTTSGTGADRLRLYVNGSRITQFASTTDPSQNADLFINSTNQHKISSELVGNYADGYLADIHFIDGQALDPTSFGEFDDNGIWQPIEYTGSFGTNGFHLPFSNNSTAAALGTDTSGAGNNWTVNNISVAAGAGNDSLVDVPTNGTETDTGVGGEVRGNYATWNPLDRSIFSGSVALSQGNLEYSGSSTSAGVKGTIFVDSGKWYWECVLSYGQTGALTGIGKQDAVYYPGYSSSSYAYSSGGTKANNGAFTSYGASYTVGDVVGVALDLDAGTLEFYKNGVSQGTAFSSLSGSFAAHTGDSGANNSTTWTVNFGQRPFAYTAPSGFKALNTANLPAPVITKPSEYMDVALYTGNGTSQTISGLDFSPDFVWIKQRNTSRAHSLVDQVRGATKELFSDYTDAELTTPQALNAFTSDGFTVGSENRVNTNTGTYVAWNWDAGSSTVTNTDGSITSSVRANPSAGFSIVTYTCQASSTATIGHGLGISPSFIITKQRNGTAFGWTCWHISIGINYYLLLQSTGAAGVSSFVWPVLPTSSVFTQGSGFSGGGSMVAYCFAPVAGYSAFGSYVGNGSSDGPFVYTGHRSRFLLIKCSSLGGSGQNWIIVDTSRDTYNISENILRPNLSDAEVDYGFVDVLSNGFKLKNTDNSVNGSGQTYVYMALAESPFNYARAR